MSVPKDKGSITHKVNEAKLESFGGHAVAKRLTTGVAVDKPAAAAAAEEPKVKMFEAPKGPQRSKIWEALNPQKLFYESRREKEEQEEDKIVVSMRGGMLGSSVKGGGIDFSYARDDEGNVIQEEEQGDDDGEPEDDYDPNNLPDFGELQGVITEKRKEREALAEQRRAALRAEYEAKKAKEKAQLDEEIAKIRAHDAKLKASLEIGTDVVKEAQARLTEVTFDFTFDATGKEAYGFE